jgi:hypothetical protein
LKKVKANLQKGRRRMRLELIDIRTGCFVFSSSGQKSQVLKFLPDKSGGGTKVKIATLLGLFPGEVRKKRMIIA